MRLINVNAFLEREQYMCQRRVNRQTKVLEFRDDEETPYAILSHRWIDPTEVDYEEMADLAKMEREERDGIRQRLGYKKILSSCEQAKRDGYEWLWVDTCCIDKGSSAELSEAINSMHRWYQNSRVCYAYLHDVPGLSFPHEVDETTYPNFNGWPEWFSRGWTLQEMIAPSDVQFFNKDWQPIGNKRTLARTLSNITRVPKHILQYGLSSNRPCVAQIMSWAANRATTRVEDRAYSLMGLLDVNMPMLYGEGKNAFHRLQREIIGMSNDQSIFAWGCNIGSGSILADDPSFFRDCAEMELMDHDEFVRYFERDIPEDEQRSIDEDRFGVFPITNRGIQIWMLLRPYRGSDSVFQAWLPCRFHPSGPSVTINLALWNSNYYRYPSSVSLLPTERTLRFRQLYLRYQGTPCNTTFEIDDSSIRTNGFNCRDVTYPSRPAGNTLTLTSTDALSVRVYSDRQAGCCFAVALGQCFGQDWIHYIRVPASGLSWDGKQEFDKMLLRGPERAKFMVDSPSRGEGCGRIWIQDNCLPQSTWIVRTSRVVWEKSRIGVRIEVFRQPGFYNDPDKWKVFDVEGINDPSRDMRGLMLRDTPHKRELLHRRRVEGVLVDLLLVRGGTKLGDYGHFTDSGSFRRKGNIFTDTNSPIPEPNINRQLVAPCSIPHVSYQRVTADDQGLSLPNNPAFNSSLASLAPRLTNAYIVRTVVQCVPSSGINDSRTTVTLCTIKKPFLWYREEGSVPPDRHTS